MQTFFQNIREFPKIRPKCIFCDHEMIFNLSNWMGHCGDVPSLTFKEIDNNFYIKISNYKGPIASLNISNNQIIIFNKDINPNIYKSEFIYYFSKLYLHLSLKCCNVECLYNYILCSSILEIEPSKIINTGIDILPFQLYMESFTFENYWIQNLWKEQTTCIYLLDDEKSIPIELPITDWSQYDLSEINNKITTFLMFS